MLIFVYGTLMGGMGNHSFLKDAKYIGRGRTRELYIMKGTSIPFVSKSRELTQIHGELYEVEDIRPIDWLEGHPSLYKREEIEVVVDRKIYTAWMYFCDQNGSTIISGDFRDVRTPQR